MQIRNTGKVEVIRRVNGENINSTAYGIEVSDNGSQWRPIGLEGALTIREMEQLRKELNTVLDDYNA